jgi:hypothetical protein
VQGDETVGRGGPGLALGLLAVAGHDPSPGK